jgi:hypothetical protein
MQASSKLFRAVLLIAAPMLAALSVQLLSGIARAREGARQENQAQAPMDERHIPLFGKITAVHVNAFDVLNPNGEKVTVKLTAKTEFRKDRQSAKRGDFKVGDIILVRGEENADHSWTAELIGARSMTGNGPNARFVGGEPTGTLGKDYVVGEVKSIDPPRISVLRSDNVAQTIELNEETSLRKGRESITMADIQVGDHLVARGALQNDLFVPKFVMVIDAEQWKRMQENGFLRSKPFTPAQKGAQPQKPSEPQR